jgi:MFS family permease
MSDPGARRLGLRANAAQFSLLVGVNALVGGVLGQERTVLPLLAEREFGLTAYTAALSFIVAFGLAKAITNYVAGTWSDRVGRKPVLVVGWLVSIPVPLLVIWAPSWSWVVAANVLLGIGQGLTWSTTVVMKIDLAGPERRGLAMGLNEAAGYGAVAVVALATGLLAERYGLRPAPFLLGLCFVGIGLGVSVLFVRETLDLTRVESGRTTSDRDDRTIFLDTSFREPALSAASQAGLVNNLNVTRIGLLAAIYPAVWGLAQLVTGALSDRLGRKWLIATGMWLQALALVLVAIGDTFAVWATAAVGLGLGTAMVYPVLLAAISDVAHPTWRARSVGTYRLWRDAGFAVGALASGVLADLFDVRVAVTAVAALTALSGVVVAVRMYETRVRG